MLNEIYQALDPIAFQIGPFAVRWYALGYIFGILIGAYILYRVARRWDIRFSTDTLLSVVIVAMLGIILGGRLGYVLFYGLEYYSAHPLEIFQFSNGGMSFHGGVIGLVVAGLLYAKFTKFAFLTLADLVVIAAPIGIFLVRIANFINGELWGAPTDAPWGVVFETGGMVARHPTQLYEALLEGVLMFVILYTLSRRKPPHPRGFYLGVFMLLYGIFRILVEFVRQPDTHIGYLLGTEWVTMGMVLSLPLVLVGIGALVFASRSRLPQDGSRE